MIDSVFSYKTLENHTIISNWKNEIKVSNDVFNSKSSNLGFRIKSQLAHPFTLLSASKATNILFELKDKNGNPVTSSEIHRINQITSGHKYIKKIKAITDSGYSIDFHSYVDKIFKLNLEMIDSDLPEIMAEIVLTKFRDKITKIPDFIKYLRTRNPMNYHLSEGHKFYEYKIKKFLTDVALGMTPSKVWTGQHDATRGYLVVKENGDVLCYHIYNKNEFEDYLFNNTKLDTASSTRHDFGRIYEEDAHWYFKLNLQIRFTK